MERHKGHPAVLGAAELAQCKAALTGRLSVLRAALMEQSESGDRDSKQSAATEVHDLKDEAFAGQLANLRGMAREQMQGEMAAVRAALTRISEGSFGRCEDCDGEIGRERLLAQPSAGRCLRCQERAEKPGSVR